MKERFLISVMLLATVTYLILVATDRVSAPKKTTANQQASEAIPSKTCQHRDMRTIVLQTVLLRVYSGKLIQTHFT
jgi:hypothetical protein